MVRPGIKSTSGIRDQRKFYGPCTYEPPDPVYAIPKNNRSSTKPLVSNLNRHFMSTYC